MSIAEKQIPLNIEKEQIEETIHKLKKKKAEDYEGWRNELMIFGGNEMIKSLVRVFNQVSGNLIIPEEWNHVVIKPFYKYKGPKMEMKSRRGIFLTNLVSKVFETIVLKNDESAMYPWQNGGRKKRSAIDNILIIKGVIDNKRRLKKKTYLIFADAEKCFDKLWLEDCLINMQEFGTREREIVTIYKNEPNDKDYN